VGGGEGGALAGPSPPAPSPVGTGEGLVEFVGWEFPGRCPGLWLCRPVGAEDEETGRDACRTIGFDRAVVGWRWRSGVACSSKAMSMAPGLKSDG